MKIRFYLAFAVALLASFSTFASSYDDHVEIGQLIQKWGVSRDQGKWDQLADTFHPDGKIHVSWFSGSFSEFVAASREMAKGSTKSKHLIGVPLITVHDDKALSETSVVIMARVSTGPFDVDITSYARFFDRLEKRNGVWRLLDRTAIYEKDRMDSVQPSFLFWLGTMFMDFDQYPEAYRYLAYGLVQNGYQLAPDIVVDKSSDADGLYANGKEWLKLSL